MADLLGDDLGKAPEKFSTLLVIHPTSTGNIESVVPGTGSRRKPYLAGSRLAAQDKFHSVGKFDGYETVAGRVIDFVRIEFFQPGGDS